VGAQKFLGQIEPQNDHFRSKTWAKPVISGHFALFLWIVPQESVNHKISKC
jgi:hypothetical protein